MMRLNFSRKFYTFKGGVHPESHKGSTASKTITPLPIPKRLYIPLLQHIGETARDIVSPGDTVLKGQLIAEGKEAISASVHAPTSGTVVAVEERQAPHPSGLPVKCIVIDSDDQDRWIALSPPKKDPRYLPEQEIAKRVRQAGIVGLGGATFPSAVKFHTALKQQVKTLIINGAECEPYLTSDDRLMQERCREVIAGIRIMMLGVSASEAIIAIEDNKPRALGTMLNEVEQLSDIRIVKVPTRYPMGSEKHLVYTITGKEIPAGKLATDIGVIVHNVGTAYAVYEAIYKGKPLVSRIVTVSGGAVKTPRNLEVPFGTLISDLIEFCDGFKAQPARILMGGPLMGMVMPNEHVPIIKGSNAIIALTEKEISVTKPSPCIRCSSCVTACPCGLLPLEMAANIRTGKFDNAVELGVKDCISCGSCAYVCPANIPLVHFFNYAKGELVARAKAEKQQIYTSELAEQRRARMEKIEAEKVAIRARALAAKKAREAAKAAQQNTERATS